MYTHIHACIHTYIATVNVVNKLRKKGIGIEKEEL